MLNIRPRQQGVTLLEMLVAIVVSGIISLSMVTLMANTMGTGTKTIGMARLTSEVRTALQIMTRDVRRSNYHGNFVRCFANPDCRSTLDAGGGDVTALIKPVTIENGDCFYYWFDRDSDGDVTDDDDVGAFRRSVVNGVGVLQMTATLNTAPSCSSNTEWTQITDPELIDVTSFVVSNALSYTVTVSASGATQSSEKISLSITANLVGDPSVSRTVQDVIRIRNDIFTPST